MLRLVLKWRAQVGLTCRVCGSQDWVITTGAGSRATCRATSAAAGDSRAMKRVRKACSVCASAVRAARAGVWRSVEKSSVAQQCSRAAIAACCMQCCFGRGRRAMHGRARCLAGSAAAHPVAARIGAAVVSRARWVAWSRQVKEKPIALCSRAFVTSRVYERPAGGTVDGYAV